VKDVKSIKELVLDIPGELALLFCSSYLSNKICGIFFPWGWGDLWPV